MDTGLFMPFIMLRTSSFVNGFKESKSLSSLKKFPPAINTSRFGNALAIYYNVFEVVKLSKYSSWVTDVIYDKFSRDLIPH